MYYIKRARKKSLRRGFKAIVKDTQDNNTLQVHYYNPEGVISISQINRNNIEDLIQKSLAEHDNERRKKILEIKAGFEKCRNDLLEKQNSQMNHFINHEKGFIIQKDQLDLIFYHPFYRGASLLDLSLIPKTEDQKMAEFNQTLKDSLIQKENISLWELKNVVTHFENLKIIMKHFADHIFKQSPIFDTQCLNTDCISHIDCTFYDLPENLKLSKSRNILEGGLKKPLQFNSNVILLLSLKSLDLDQIKILGENYPDLDQQKIIKYIKKIIENLIISHRFKIGEYLLDFEKPLDKAGFVTSGDSGGAVVYQDQAVGVVNRGYVPLFQNIIFVDKDDMISVEKPLLSKKEISHEGLTGLGEETSENKEISEDESTLKSNLSYLDLAQLKLKNYEKMFDLHEQIKLLQIQRENPSLQEIDEIKVLIEQKRKKILTDDKIGSDCYFFLFSTQAPWIKQTLQHIRIDVEKEDPEKFIKEKEIKEESIFKSKEKFSITQKGPLNTLQSNFNLHKKTLETNL